MSFGTKPSNFLTPKKAWTRDEKRLEYLQNHSFVLDELLRCQNCFERRGVDMKAELAEIFSVSRARFTQQLDLLKLPGKNNVNS